MKAASGTMDGIIDTVSAEHPVAALLELLKPMGQMVVVGLPAKPLEVPAFSLVAGRKRVARSGGGGIVGMDYVNTAIQRLERNDVRYRFVVDVAGSKLGISA
jgi:cinnamyl-alcohol dehydrogenase